MTLETQIEIQDGLKTEDVKRIFHEDVQVTTGEQFEKMGYQFTGKWNGNYKIYKKRDVLLYYDPVDHGWYSAIDKGWLK